MFKSIQLGHFKAFGATQQIPIRPLTLIFGPNSAGKSSFLHGLLFAHEAQTSDEPDNLDVRRTRLGGDSVDLGGFRQFVHRRNVGSKVEWGVEIDAAQLRGRLAELLAPVRSVTVSVFVGVRESDPQDLGSISDIRSDVRSGPQSTLAMPRVEAYQLSTDGRVLIRSSLKRRSDDWRLGVDELDTDNPVVRSAIKAIVESTTTTDEFHEEDFLGVAEVIDALVPNLSLARSQFLPTGVESLSSDRQSPSTPTLFPISKGNRQEDLRRAVEFFLPRVLGELVGGVDSYVVAQLRRLKYLGPLRSYPPRHLAFAQYHDPNWYAGGGYAWDRVRQDRSIREQVNAWLSSPARMKTPYELTIRQLISPDESYDSLWDGVQDIFNRLSGDMNPENWEELAKSIPLEELSTSETPSGLEAWDPDTFVQFLMDRLKSGETDAINDLVLRDVHRKTVVSHRDVGIGVSQVLPVLVAAFSADQDTVAIEQPEIHLHPALQAELGDVFITSALNGKNNSFLLETHSEHLMLRVMRRMRETQLNSLPDGFPRVRPEDVSVLYVEPETDGSIVRAMPLNELGELVKAWPGGFFEEGLREVF